MKPRPTIPPLKKITKDSDLEENEFFNGKREHAATLMGMTSENIHHEGQIAAILDIEEWMKGT